MSNFDLWFLYNFPDELLGNIDIGPAFGLSRRYLESVGIGYAFELDWKFHLAGRYQGAHGANTQLSFWIKPAAWFNPSLHLQSSWQSTGNKPLSSGVFSSEKEGDFSASAELRFLLIPFGSTKPFTIKYGFNVGAIAGFASPSISDIDLGRDFELAIFAGPEVNFGVPVNISTQFDFGVLLSNNFQDLAFAFNFRIFTSSWVKGNFDFN